MPPQAAGDCSFSSWASCFSPWQPRPCIQLPSLFNHAVSSATLHICSNPPPCLERKQTPKCGLRSPTWELLPPWAELTIWFLSLVPHQICFWSRAHAWFWFVLSKNMFVDIYMVIIFSFVFFLFFFLGITQLYAEVSSSQNYVLTHFLHPVWSPSPLQEMVQFLLLKNKKTRCLYMTSYNCSQIWKEGSWLMSLMVKRNY